MWDVWESKLTGVCLGHDWEGCLTGYAPCVMGGLVSKGGRNETWTIWAVAEFSPLFLVMSDLPLCQPQLGQLCRILKQTAKWTLRPPDAAVFLHKWRSSLSIGNPSKAKGSCAWISAQVCTTLLLEDKVRIHLLKWKPVLVPGPGCGQLSTSPPCSLWWVNSGSSENQHHLEPGLSLLREELIF